MRSLILCLWLAAFSRSVSAAVLTNVPMQGSMLMPEVYYHADTDRVTVDLSSIVNVAQLTPLLVSHPNDRFAPADPWFESLDPSRQGLAFSRRYGFDMDYGSDILPIDRELWIRKLSSSPGLLIYDYSATPKKWTPIFGTAGSSNAAWWDRVMWHVGVAAPPGTNTYSATFEVYVVNSTTGTEIPGSGSGPFTLDWTNVPDGRPRLNITPLSPSQIELAWPATAIDWVLVTAETLNPAEWTVVTNAPVERDGQFTVVLDSSGPPRIFGLKLNR